VGNRISFDACGRGRQLRRHRKAVAGNSASQGTPALGPTWFSGSAHSYADLHGLAAKAPKAPGEAVPSPRPEIAAVIHPGSPNRFGNAGLADLSDDKSQRVATTIRGSRPSPKGLRSRVRT
jgi:hypothetical protein